MPIQQARLTIDAGADFSAVFFWTIPGNPPTPVDFTSATAQMMVRQTPGDPSPLISISTTPNSQGQVNLGNVDGVTTAGAVQIKLTHTATSSLKVTTAGFDLQITLGDGSVTEFLRGSVWVNLAFTH